MVSPARSGHPETTSSLRHDRTPKCGLSPALTVPGSAGRPSRHRRRQDRQKECKTFKQGRTSLLRRDIKEAAPRIDACGAAPLQRQWLHLELLLIAEGVLVPLKCPGKDPERIHSHLIRDVQEVHHRVL